MCKTNKKMYLQNTNEEVCIGDKVTVSLKVVFDKYPDMLYRCSYKDTFDENLANLFIEGNMIHVKEEKPVEEYTTYLKWLADKEGMQSSEIFKTFSYTLQINPNAALSVLLKAISRKVYAKSTVSPRKVWLINNVTHKPYIADVSNANNLKNIAWFVSKEDAEYALKVCKPIIDKYFNN